MTPPESTAVSANPWQGFLWLSRRECHRVLRLWTQTTLAPVVSSLLFIVVFGLLVVTLVFKPSGLLSQDAGDRA